jgi:hypothetical protein
MYQFRVSLIVLAAAIGIVGCTNRTEHRLTAPGKTPADDSSGSITSDIAEARWITGDDDVRSAAQRAGKSPLVQRAAADVSAGMRVAFMPSGVVAAVGRMKDGRSVRVTILPYQYANDSTRAAYVAMLEVNADIEVQTFELLRHREAGLPARGFAPVNSGANGIWIREGSAYVPTSEGIAKRSAERFNWARFGTCMIPTADLFLNQAHETCHEMGSFPGCVAFGSGIAMLGAIIYCALVAMSK